MIPRSNCSRNASNRAHSCSRSVTANSAATASPTANATFSVPARRPRSCDPPTTHGLERSSAANVQRADSFWRTNLVTGNREQIERNFACVHVHFAERLHAIGVKNCARRALVCSASSFDGLDDADFIIHPHHARNLQHVHQRDVLNSSFVDLRRYGSTEHDRRSSPPSRATSCTAASTALCSMGVVTAALRPDARSVRNTPRMARLSPSVPQDVKHTSSAFAPRQAATRSRASSSATRASRPHRCTLEGFPNRAPKYGAMASRTSGLTGVVAAWSKYTGSGIQLTYQQPARIAPVLCRLQLSTG